MEYCITVFVEKVDLDQGFTLPDFTPTVWGDALRSFEVNKLIWGDAQCNPYYVETQPLAHYLLQFLPDELKSIRWVSIKIDSNPWRDDEFKRTNGLS